jgi:2,4-dienoyl-CoA reductase-like NADH-dependent reductase (Old Yellow Enzyme family)
VDKGDPKSDANGTKKDAKRPFEALSRPLRIGPVEVKNRVVVPALATGFGSWEGYVTERCISYYLERARGGAGLLVVEPAAVAAEGRIASNTPLIDDDKYIQMHSRLCDVVHAEGAKLFLQLVHAGRKTSSRVTGSAPVGPSPEPDPDFGETPVELGEPQVRGVVQAFVSAAANLSRRTTARPRASPMASSGGRASKLTIRPTIEPFRLM